MTRKARLMRVAALCVMLTCLFVLLPPLSVDAATEINVNVKMPVEQDFRVTNGDRDVDDEFTYRLTREDDDSPMPSGSNGDDYTFTMTDDDSRNITIKYDRVGIYYYELRQVIPSNTSSRYTYDRTVYRVMVVVQNDNKAYVKAAEDDNLNNKTELVFENRYRGPDDDRYPPDDDPPRATDPPGPTIGDEPVPLGLTGINDEPVPLGLVKPVPFAGVADWSIVIVSLSLAGGLLLLAGAVMKKRGENRG
jgi:hypothetical protein